MSGIGHLDKKKLAALAEVTEFRDEQIAELADILALYASRFDRELDAPPLVWPDLQPMEKFERSARLGFIQAVRDVWIDAGGGAQIGSYTVPSGGAKGPLLELILALLRSYSRAGLWCKTTIHHDIVYLSTGQERSRGR